MEYPDEPLPDLEDLKKDFDSCVLAGDPECTFAPGSNVLGYKDHRSQMMAFCGHEPICALFDNHLAMQIAKANVERYYPVVGVLEHLNTTLEVMEVKVPSIFKGAKEVLHSKSHF